MRVPHKLAAVLFADIAGYSAMMASNEELAMEKLSIFKATINKSTLTHSGKVVQYFGDGCLCTFESSLQAVECAAAIQNALGKGTLVPVRIGIHIGDVVFKEGNVFGDAVNVASRIESIGQPGTVLVSSSIRKHVKSIADFEFVSLGHFDFKNIDESVEVYALSNMGFKVPTLSSIEGKLKNIKGSKRIYENHKRQLWWGFGVVAAIFIIYFVTEGNLLSPLSGKSPMQALKDEGIVLFDFLNKTGDSTYDDLQCEIHKYLTIVFHKNNVKVHNNSTLCHTPLYLDVLKSQIIPGPTLESLTKSKFALEGQLSLKGDSIEVNVRIYRTLNNESLFIPFSILVSKKDPIGGIKKMIEALIDSWNIPEKPTFPSNPLQIEWLTEYEKAISYFEKDYNKVLEHIKNCKKIDSTKHIADLLALEVYIVLGKNDKRDSLLDILDQKSDMLSESELNLLNVQIAIKHKNHNAAVELYKREYEKDPKNLFVNFAMISHSVKLVNRSELAALAGKEIQDNLLEYDKCEYCQDRLTLLARAYIEIKEYDEALEALEHAERMEIDIQNSGNMELQIRALTRKGDEERLKQKLELSKYKKYTSNRDYPYFLYWTAYEYFLIGDKEKTLKYRELFEKEIADKESRGNNIRRGRLQIFLGEYGSAEKIFKEIAAQYAQQGSDRQYLYKALHGFTLARTGKVREARDILNYLESTKDTIEFEENLAYYQSYVSIGLGEIDNTISYLTESLAKGKTFTRWEFQYDALLKEIHDEEWFRNLINNI